MKKKRNISSQEQLLQLTIPSHLIPDNHDIQKNITLLLQEKTFIQQQKCLITLSECLNNPKNKNQQDVAELLTYIYLHLNSSEPLKKTLNKILTHSKPFVMEIITKSFINQLKSVMIKVDDCNSLDLSIILNSLNTCLNNSDLGLKAISFIYQDVFNYVSSTLIMLSIQVRCSENGSSEEKENVNNYLHSVSRICLSLLQKFGDDLSVCCMDIIHSCYNIMCSSYIFFDTKLNCGLILTSLFHKLPKDITQTFEYKNSPALELLNYGENLGKLHIKDFSNDETIKVVVISGILNVVPRKDLCTLKFGDKEVIFFLFEELLMSIKRTTGHPAQILEVSRTLILLSGCLNQLPVTSVIPLFKQGMVFVWSHLEHCIDTVRHSTKSVFLNFIKLAIHHKQSAEYCLLKIIVDAIFASPEKRSTRYIALSLLCEEVGCSYVVNKFDNIQYSMLKNINDKSIALHIYNTYKTLMKKHYFEVESEDIWMKKWVEIILPFLNQTSDSNFNYYQELIISAFQITSSVLKIIQRDKDLSNVNEIIVLLGCLRSARKSGSTVLLGSCYFHNPNNSNEYWRNMILCSSLDLFLFHQYDEIRVNTLALIVECQKSTEIFTEWECRFLLKFLKYNSTTDSPHIRKQITSLFKKAITRFFEGHPVIIRNIKNLENKLKVEPENCQLQSDLKISNSCNIYYQQFCFDFMTGILIDGIKCRSNYSRRSFCLELLLHINHYVQNKDWNSYWKTEDIDSLHQLIFDSYESNREMAVNLLIKFSPNRLHLSTLDECADYLKKCLLLASDAKVHNISAAYMLEVILLSPYLLNSIEQLNFETVYKVAEVELFNVLISKISDQLHICDEDIYSAAKKCSIYGILFSIRHLFLKQDLSKNVEKWKSLIENLLLLCFKVALYVEPIVTNSSPEGFFPTQNEYIICETDDSAKAQMLLFFAWRTMSEIALLMGDITSKVFQQNKDLSLLNELELCKISDFFIHLFMKTKHRGVFEQASVGFTNICQAFWNSSNQKFRDLPKQWLIGMIEILSKTVKEKNNILCATRRSAGVPFMIVSILVSEPITEYNKTFHMCIEVLLKIANDKSSENDKTRQHCLNILRAIYRHNQLGEIVIPYVSEGIKVAFEGLESRNWNIRNSATLLFGSLIIRIFGVHRTRNLEELCMKNRMPVHVFFTHYPDLESYLLSKLSLTIQENSIFAVLIILIRLYYSHFDESSYKKLDAYVPYIKESLAGPVYKIRSYSAHASTNFTSNNDIRKNIAKIIFQLHNKKITNNLCHGLLLQLRYLLNNLPEDKVDMNISKIIQPTFWIITHAGYKMSYIVAILYMKALIKLTTKFMNNCYNAPVFRKLCKLLLHKNKNVLFPSIFKKFNIYKFYLRLHLCANILAPINATAYLISREICLAMFSEEIELKMFSFNFVNYLNVKNECNEMYEDDEEEDDLTKCICELISSFSPNFRNSLLKEFSSKSNILLFINLKKILRSKCVDYLYLGVSVLRFYPHAMFYMIESKQMLIDFLVKLANNENENLICVLIKCTSNFLKHLAISCLESINLKSIPKLLLKCSSPASSISLRLAVSELFIENYNLLFSHETCFAAENLLLLWNIVIILLNDDDKFVRNTISDLSTKTDKSHFLSNRKGIKIIPEKASEDLFQVAVNLLPRELAIYFLFVWIIQEESQHFAEIDNNCYSEVFDRGDLNLYIEVDRISKMAIRLLKDTLLSSDIKFSYQEKVCFFTNTILSIFIRYGNLSLTKSSYFAYKSIFEAVQSFFNSCSKNDEQFESKLKLFLSHKKIETDDTINKQTFSCVGSLSKIFEMIL